MTTRLAPLFVACSTALATCFCSAPAQPPTAASAAPKKAINKLHAPELQGRAQPDRKAKKISADKPTLETVSVKAGGTLPIRASQPIRGTLSRGDHHLDDGSLADFYVYSGTRGERLTITLRSDDFDAYLLVGHGVGDGFAPDDEDDDGGEGTDAKLDVTLESTGPFVIVANAIDGGETGRYQLHVVSRASSSVDDASMSMVHLEPGAIVNGSLGRGDRVMSEDRTFYDLFTFEGQAGQRVRITMRSDTIDPYLILARGIPSNGRMQAFEDDDDSGGGVDAQIQVMLPETGLYSILANSAEPESGAYSLSLNVATEAAPYRTRYRTNGAADEKYAVVVGIDNYPGRENDLRGPVADAKLFRALLIDHFGFKPENIVTLADEEATRENILTAFSMHLGQAGPRGSAVFYYSGHGTQMDGNVGIRDVEDDGIDEALFVWGTSERSSIVLDDEIGEAIDHLNTDNVLIIHDSCFSGTSSRGTIEGGQVKEVKFDKQGPDRFYRPTNWWLGKQARPSAAGGSRPAGPPGSRGLETTRPHALLAASRDDETSKTADGWPDKGGVASVFTYYLVTALENADASTALTTVMDKVRVQAVNYTKTKYSDVQTPQAYGPLAHNTIGSILGGAR